MNRRAWLRKAYDKWLQEYDVLMMPTVPVVAMKLPDANCTVGGKLWPTLLAYVHHHWHVNFSINFWSPQVLYCLKYMAVIDLLKFVSGCRQTWYQRNQLMPGK